MPTLKQKAAADKITENHGNLKKTMLEVGYDYNTAKKPTNLTESKGWQELMAQRLPDPKLLTVHERGLDSYKTISARITYKDADEKTDDFIEVPDFLAQAKFLDMAYKLKNKYPQESNNLTQINIGGELGVSVETYDSDKTP